jgi:hypothetical protein
LIDCLAQFEARGLDRVGVARPVGPDWVQLDSLTLKHYFGLDVKIEQSFPHGFITTKLFPASFCELGIERFRAELAAFPSRRPRSDSASSGRTGQHRLEFGNLIINLALLFLESKDGGVDDVSGELVGWHVSLS